MFSTCVEIGRNPHKEAEHMLDRFQWERRHSRPSTPSLFNFFTLVECFPKLSHDNLFSSLCYSKSNFFTCQCCVYVNEKQTTVFPWELTATACRAIFKASTTVLLPNRPASFLLQPIKGEKICLSFVRPGLFLGTQCSVFNLKVLTTLSYPCLSFMFSQHLVN